MGEFIKNWITGEEIKIGVLDECFISREELIDYKKKGFRGFYNGKFDLDAGRKDSINIMLDNPSSLYRIPKGTTYNERIHTVMLHGGEIKHKKVTLQKTGNRGSCYTWTGLKCELEGSPTIWAKIRGFRYNEEGRPRTIFECDCCGAFFSLEPRQINKLKEKYPYWISLLVANLTAPLEVTATAGGP